jgi:hypothetical protein
MKRFVFLVTAILVFLSACKDKKKVPLNEENDEVTSSEFVESFPDISLPFQLYDSSLVKKPADSLMVATKLFTQFFPDSIFRKDFGKSTPVLYAIGKAAEKNHETYLFVRAAQGSKRACIMICLDNENKYLNAMTLVRSGFDNTPVSYGMLDKKFQITTYKERRMPTGETNYKRNIYVYNSGANDFTLILTEPNEDEFENIINPIDTLPSTNKMAGDYRKDKQNFISFRDGRNDKELQFFVHFEREKDDCRGELKGVARMTDTKTAQYKEAGNPCTLEFTFNASNVQMKEVEGCGSYRDIKCFFEGTFPKKKEVKPKTSKKKK